MNNARHKSSGEIVTAADACYRHLTRVTGYEKADNFECEGCRVTVRCINFGKAKEDMKVRPAFSTRWSSEGNHLNGCIYKLGEIIEDLLLDKHREEYAPGPITFTLGTKRPTSNFVGKPSPALEEDHVDRLPIKVTKKRRARHRMEDLLWLPESELELVHDHPNVHIRTSKGTFLSSEYLAPLSEVNWGRGHGIVYGKAFLNPRSGSKGEFFSVNFVGSDPERNKVKGNLFVDRFADDEKLQKALRHIDARPYQVAIWWSDARAPDPLKYPNMQTAQIWFEIRAIAVKAI